MTPVATGRKDPGDPSWVVFTRTFRAPVEQVWTAVTEPAALSRWIGTWKGDPASGQVYFIMTAEGDDVAPEHCRIEECRPPTLLRLTLGEPAWTVRLELSESDGVTTLDFAQRLTDPDVAASVGPGWDYYLDRLVAAVDGDEVAAVDFDGYYPGLSDHYRALLD
jgi:uncharacterized protein YndB with AHSA1/START domain